MKVSNDVARRALAAGRADKVRDSKRFMVRSVNKDGSVSRAAPTASDWRLNAFVERSDAEARLSELEALNPGRQFTVVDLGA